MTSLRASALATPGASLTAAGDGDARAAFGEFLRLRVADGDASPATLRTYQSHVATFYAWCKAQGVNPAQATEGDLEAYRAALVAQGLARDTVALKLAAVRRFFEAATWRGLRADNPAAGLKAPRNRTSREERIKFLPAGYIARLLATVPGDDPQALRDRALLILFALHGPRVAELADLDIADVDLTGEPATARVTGKGDKARTLYLVPTARAALAAWLAARAQLAQVDPDAVFVTLQPNQAGEAGRRMTARSIRRRVDVALVAAGLKREGVSCHSLRHSFGTWSAAAGASVAAISAAMGHASIDTTGVYVKVADAMKQNPAAYLERWAGLAS